MKLHLTTPAKSLNKAYFKQSLKREQIEAFKAGLQTIFNHSSDEQDEEYHKNLISAFLLSVYCKGKYLVNVNKRQDLVIRLGNNPSDNVGVILEFKKPKEKRDMVTPEKPNVKALQELVLYYLRETIDNNNHQIKHLIVTNIDDWFIYDELWFEKNIFRNSKLKIQYEEWKLSGHDTKHFYELIAAPHLDAISEELECTWFNLKSFEKIITNPKKVDDNKLIDLYKILSPEHLLKKSFANDSNTLNKEFYNELLHIIGLEEVKEGSKKIIRRKNEADRSEASLIENAVSIIRRSKGSGSEDSTEVESIYYDTALELSITWLNRILFLKLLEGQLIKYHRGNKDYAFLNINRVQDYDALDELFFEVLAIPETNRNSFAREKFGNVPYLNSSLFEQTDLEMQYIGINQLKDRVVMPVYSGTVLKDSNGKRILGNKNPLTYLYEFLDAYDFASDSAAQIQEENKSIINASVLGLIFEKINGYKDGSFFTPGFITMYMCRETIRKAVLQKFNEAYKWECNEFSDLKDKIDHTDKQQRQNANEIVNSLRICDPAVGSGHFLVSALNEMLCVKHDLQVLNFKDGSRVKGYKFEIENDELIIINEETDELFEYILNQNGKPIDELQRLQEALFHEKQNIIENSLFGVDINPKSVTICRLRLWIELLKNSYYTQTSDYKRLETLPNIDINIKRGNSLVSRFAINDKNTLLPKDRPFVKQLIEKYKILVFGYKNSRDKRSKDDFRRQINYIKTEVEKFTFPNDKEYANLKKKEAELMQSVIVFDPAEKERLNKLAEEVAELTEKYQQKLQAVYGNSFEWRFEFPEVLNEEGQFKGFDLVIGNPPYLNFKMYSSAERDVFKNDFKEIFDGKADIYYFFFLQGLHILNEKGLISFITSRYWLEAEFAEKLRKTLSNSFSVKEIIDFKNVSIFDGIGIKTSIATFQNAEPQKDYTFNYKFIDIKKILTVEIEQFTTQLVANDNIKSKSKWVFGEEGELNVYYKIESGAQLLESIAHCKQGIVTGLDKAFITTKSEFKNIPQQYIKPWIKVGDISRYSINPVENRQLVYTNEIPDIQEFPDLLKRLMPFQEKLSERREAKSGKIRWYDLQWARDPDTFNSPKLVCRFKASQNTFAFDDKKYFSSADTTVVTLKKEFAKEYDLKFILALVNSKLLDFYFKSYGKLMDYRYEYYPGPVGQLRIKRANNQADFVEIVNEILDIKSEDQNADTKVLEYRLDQMIYQLYLLTADEIKIIEDSYK